MSGPTQASLGVEAPSSEAYCVACNQSFPHDATHCPNDGSRLVKLSKKRDELIGKTLDGRYQIRAALGEGGMGTVYRGMQLTVERPVAIKVVRPSIANEIEAAKRFLREARLASRLNSPSIVNVFDFGQSEDGVLYLVMELIEGNTLSTELRKHGKLSVDRTLRIAMQLCDALDAAHEQSIIHRDLKPSNIMLLSTGRDIVKVLDFGLAKTVAQESSGITNTHAMLGTPSYMAPEQIEGQDLDGRADLYSLGCILFELLVGTPPFVESTMSALLARQLTEQPPRLPDHVPAKLVQIVDRLLQKSRDARTSSCAELREALAAIAPVDTPPAGIPIVAWSAAETANARVAVPHTIREQSVVEAPGRARSRRFGVIAAIAGIAIVAGIAITIAASGSPNPPTAETEIESEIVPAAASDAAATDATRADAGLRGDAAARVDAISIADARVVVDDAQTPSIDASRIDDAAITVPPRPRPKVPPPRPPTVDAGVKKLQFVPTGGS